MRVAIVGAGLNGLEAAARLLAEGHEAVVFEAGEPGDGVRAWAHVHLFTPWSMITSARGRALVGDPALADDGVCPSGQDVLDRYLLPLARKLPVRSHHRVFGVAACKESDRDGGKDVFRLLIDGPHGEIDVIADQVLDCTGAVDRPVATGVGGLPALGERDLGPGRLLYAPQPVDHLAGKRVLVVGDGASACTILVALITLDPQPEVTWIGRRADGPSLPPLAEDPLPARRALHQAVLDAISDAHHHRVTHRVAEVVRYGESGRGVDVELSTGDHVVVDHVIGACGFRSGGRFPDLARATTGV